MEVKKYDSSLEGLWEEFVLQSNNGTIFNLRRFLSYHKVRKFEDHSLCFLKNRKIFALFPAAELYDREEKKLLVSHPGASYGGIITKKNIGIKNTLSVVEKLIEYTRKNSFDKLIITMAPFIYHTYMNNYVDFALYTRGFRYLRRELTSVLSLEFEDNEVFTEELKRNIKKAIRSGIMVLENRDFENYYEILKNNLKMRHNVTPTHTLQELTLLNKLFPLKIRLFAAYLKTKMVGGIVLFVCNERAVLAFYISHNEKYQEYRVVDLLISEVIRWCRIKGFKYLDFGTFTLNMNPNFGLGKFKEKFGAKGIFRDTFYLNL